MQVFDIGSFDAEIEPTLGFDRKEWTNAYTQLRNLRQRVKKSRLAQLDAEMGLTDLHKLIPSHDVCEVLIANYARTFGRLYRVINMQQFQGQLNQFWDDPQAIPMVSCYPQL